MNKPSQVFDRQAEWAALTRFVTSAEPGAALGVVRGRRRQGKSTLLEALRAAAGGLRLQATQAKLNEQLELWGRQIGTHRGALAPRLRDPDDLLTVLGEVAAAHHRPTVVVIDELPYLLHEDPALPSRLQVALDPGGPLRGKPLRLLLCGSALSVMDGLLAGPAPLRGRARLELDVRPFDYRTAAAFWDLEDDLPAALRVHATVGGTPAYRREFVDGEGPAEVGGFDRWVTDVVLDPTRPLLHEARNLLAAGLEDQGVRDRALYESLVAAVATGATTPRDLASRVGRRITDLAHPLALLTTAGYLRKDEDALKQRAPSYAVTEPLLAFAAAVLRPHLAALEGAADPRRIWEAGRAAFGAQLLGPAFEQLCREWTRDRAGPDTLGGVPQRVGRAVVSDPSARTMVEVDVVARDGDRVLAIGEAHVGGPIRGADLARLERVRARLVARGWAASAGAIRILAFSERGAAPEVSTHPDVEVVDLARLYRGD